MPDVSGTRMCESASAMRATLDPQRMPLCPPSSVASWGPTLVIAPHPDDEVIGCGGAIQLLLEHRQPVTVLVISDGTGSHPNSKCFPADRLRELRERECLAGLARLGVDHSNVDFLRLPDRYVPRRGTDGFEQATGALVTAMSRRSPWPSTVLIPWRRDPHGDHRAAWELCDAAQMQLGLPFRVIEYPVWLWENGTVDDYPGVDEMRDWRLDITAVMPVKQAALMCHRSQVSDLINDDPAGFRLTPEMLSRFMRPWEVYLEPKKESDEFASS